MEKAALKRHPVSSGRIWYHLASAAITWEDFVKNSGGLWRVSGVTAKEDGDCPGGALETLANLNSPEAPETFLGCLGGISGKSLGNLSGVSEKSCGGSGSSGLPTGS